MINNNYESLLRRGATCGSGPAHLQQGPGVIGRAWAATLDPNRAPNACWRCAGLKLEQFVGTWKDG